MLQSRSLPSKATLIAISLLATTLGYAQTEEAPTPPPAPAEPAPVEAEAPTPPAPPAPPAAPAGAPDAPAAPAAATKAKTSERVEVTGTRIKRVEAETSAPVIQITREQLDKSGTTSLGEFFQKSASASPTGNFVGQSGYVSAGSSSIDLLGLGASRTLVLVNGKRLPVLPGLGASNVETIPTALVERIEVLSGGASAVYGADAVGGVVNIVTRKDLVGTKATGAISVPMRAGGEEKSVSVAQGLQVNDNLSVQIAAGARERNALDVRHRDMARSFPERTNTLSNAPAGTYSYQPVYVAGGAISVGDWAASPNCPAELAIATVPEEPNNVYCTGPRKGLPNELLSKRSEWFATSTFDYAVNDNWTVNGLLSYTAATTKTNNGHSMYAIDPLTDAPIVLSTTTATALGVPVDPNSQYIQLYGPTTEAKDNIYENLDSTFVSNLSLGGDIGDWATSFSLNYASSTVERKGKNLVNKEARSQIFVNPNTPLGEDPAFIPIDPNRDLGLLYGTTGSLKSKEWSDTFSVDGFASRELFELPGGPFSLGFGASYTSERFQQKPDPLDELKASTNEPLYVGTFADSGKGSRGIGSVYSEFFAPVHSMVDVDGALRFDSYSDVDPSVNYGLGTKVKLLPEFAIRGRASSSYKAPPLAYVHQEGGGGYLVVEDPEYCARENAENRFCDPRSPARQLYVDFPGNKDLDPEVGINYNLGFVLEPVTGVTVTSDYHWVFLKKTFQVDSFQRVVDRWYAENGTAANANGKQSDNNVQTDEDGIITQIGTPYRNLGRSHIRLWNSKIEGQHNFNPFILGYESSYNRIYSYKSQEAEGLPNRQLKGYYGVPEWRWNNSIDLGVREHIVTLAARTIARQQPDPDPINTNAWVRATRVGEYTEYDIAYSGLLPWRGEVQVGVNNVFNKIGGLYRTSAVGAEDVVAGSLYSYLGRAYFMRYTQSI